MMSKAAPPPTSIQLFSQLFVLESFKQYQSGNYIIEKQELSHVRAFCKSKLYLFNFLI